MQNKLIACLAVTAVLCGAAKASPLVIAGSELSSPPAYWDNSFWGITSTIDRAFPFEVVPQGEFRVDALEVAAFHYTGLAGRSATFSLRNDLAGLPGSQLADFRVDSISTSPSIHRLVPSERTVLHSDRAYWIVGETNQGQVNWNMGDSVFGGYAYRVGQGEWTVGASGNISAFAILGTPVPEPATILLLCTGAIAALVWKKRRSR